MTGTPARVAAFGGILALVLGAGIGLGRLVGPDDTEPTAHEAGGHAEDGHAGSGQEAAGGHASTTPAGLESAAGGYTLHLVEDRLAPGRQRLAFHVMGPDGAPVTSYDVQHEKELHLIAVRRDLTGFQHVHPDRAVDGTWSVDLDLTPGVWRVLADTAPTGGEPVVLGADLTVPGDFDPEPLGEQTLSSSVDGYDVTLGGLLQAGVETELALTVQRRGEPVTDLEPYLGANGHLVALRSGDLGYLHVHPDEGDGTGPAIRFHTSFPSAGTYRLFLDFQHEGVVRTASFTVEVGGAGATDEPETGQHGTGHEH
ncbi:hypothetical protein [Nocardioides sp. W7]|uniref:hypothetical protein n=1 Tax=Nocardioides sp. W7 TaxID=2931390 RepID=UPI001FD17AC2|nr:hypothetical protein [Nocardioides sp. W7]